MSADHSHFDCSRHRYTPGRTSKDFSPQWVPLGLLMSNPKHGCELHQFFAPPSPVEQVRHLDLSQICELLKVLKV
jgi:hypothetical protein